MKHRIITFAGRKGSGKSQLATALAQKINAVRISFANGLKELCCELLNIKKDENPKVYLTDLDRLKRENIDINCHYTPEWGRYLYEQTGINEVYIKHFLSDRTFHSVRELLQVIGTDLIRKYKPNWHVEKTKEQIEKVPIDVPIVIDDLRFPNEKKLLEEYQADIYYVIRPNLFDYSNHISERSLNYRDFTNEHIIVNNKDVEYLNKLVERYCSTGNFVNASALEQLDIDKDEYVEELTNVIPKLCKAENPLEVLVFVDNVNIFVLEDLKALLNLRQR